MRSLLFVLLLSELAMALGPVAPSPFEQNCLKKNIDFVPSQEFFKKMPTYLGMMQAEFSIEVAAKKRSETQKCSASVVSDNGVLLTAGHCIEQCLADERVYEKSGQIYVVNKSQLAKATCKIKVNDQELEYKVLATNDCPKNSWFVDEGESRCKGLDYAVLEPVQKMSFDVKCFKLNSSQPAPGQKSLSINFPMENSKRRLIDKNAKDSKAGGQFVSSGEVLSAQQFCSTKSGQDIEFGQSQETSIVMRNVENGYQIQTSNDFLLGSSGGAVALEDSGELTAVVSRFVNENSIYKECQGSAFSSTVYGILKDLKSNYPSLNSTQAFNCSQKSFLPNKKDDSI